MLYKVLKVREKNIITRRSSEIQLKIKEEITTPQKQANKIMSRTNTPFTINESNEKINPEKMKSPTFNIHIHIPPMNNNGPLTPIPAIQPIIHLHFNDKKEKIDSGQDSSGKSSVNNSINESILNLLSLASPKTFNVSANFKGSSNSYCVSEASLENSNRNSENDQSETELEYNCKLNNRRSRKMILEKTNKGLVQMKNNSERNLKMRKKNRDFKSVMPSLEKKINSLVRNHLRASISSLDESDRECNDTMQKSVNTNCNLLSSSMSSENAYKLKKAVVKLKDISKTNCKLTSSDDCLNVKTNGSCGLLNDSVKTVSSEKNETNGGGYFLRRRKEVPKVIVTDEVNCVRENPLRRSLRINASVNNSPKKNIDEKKTNRTPQKSIVIQNTNKKFRMSSLEDMKSNTNTTPKRSAVNNKDVTSKKDNVTKDKNSFIEHTISDIDRTPQKNSATNDTEGTNNFLEDTISDIDGTPQKNSATNGTEGTNNFIEDTISDIDGTPQKNSATNETEGTNNFIEDTISDIDGTPEKNSAKNDTEVIENEKSMHSDSGGSEIGESWEIEEDVITDKEVEKSGESSNRDSDSGGSDSESDVDIEIINCPKKFSSLEGTPKSSLTSTQKNEKDKLGETTTKPDSIVTSESEDSDTEVGEECEDDASENKALLSLKKKNGGVYHSVYNSDNEKTSSEKRCLTSLIEGCNFSEILKKLQDKGLRDKITDSAARRRATLGKEPGLGEKVQQRQECILERRGKNECLVFGSGSPKKNGKVREEEEKEKEKEDENPSEEVEEEEDENPVEEVEEEEDKNSGKETEEEDENPSEEVEEEEDEDENPVEEVEEEEDENPVEEVEEEEDENSGKETEEEDENPDKDTEDETPRSSFCNEDDKSTVDYNGDTLCTLGEAIKDKRSPRDKSAESDLRDNREKVSFANSKNVLFNKYFKSDKNQKSSIKDFNLEEKTRVNGEREKVDVGEKTNSLREGQKFEEKKSSDSNIVQLDCIRKEMFRRGLGIKSGKKNKRKPEKKKKKKPQKSESPSETSPTPQKKMKLSEEKPSSNKSEKTFTSEKNYIPLQVSGPTKFAVAPLDNLKPYENVNAMNFKEKMLFGDRVRRFSSSKKFEMYKMKQKAGIKQS